MQQTGIFAGRTEVRCPYARWGWTRGGGKVWHGGLDLAGLDDATIRMPYYKGKRITGRVTRARIVTDRRDKTWEWGYYVCVQLDRGQTPDAVNFLYFAHCASLLVKAGQRVASGDALAVMGNTGNAALADPPYKHCHLEVRAAAGGVGLDPTVYAGCENAVGVYGAAGRMQVITVGPVTQGDADAVLEVCRARGLVDAGLYRKTKSVCQRQGRCGGGVRGVHGSVRLAGLACCGVGRLHGAGLGQRQRRRGQQGRVVECCRPGRYLAQGRDGGRCAGVRPDRRRAGGGRCQPSRAGP